MPFTTQEYPLFYQNAFGGATSGGTPNVDWLSDTIKMALLSSSYTPNLDTDDFFNDVSANEITGTGYTAGGATLASKTLTYTAANSWGVTRANSTAYAVNDLVRPASGNGYLYQCVVAGTSGGSIPTYPTTLGGTVVDGGVTWLCVGRGVTVFDAADPAWSSATFSGARYGVIYDTTPGSAAANPLLWLLDFGSDQSVSSGTFTVQFHAAGIAYKIRS